MGGFAYELEREAITRTDIPEFRVGDSVDVHVKIKEGEKERIQIFSGVVDRPQAPRVARDIHRAAPTSGRGACVPAAQPEGRED